MKHFRDLVLSTKEPALHNVLWIKPVDLETYRVFMYEDGWKLLIGGEGSNNNGIGYKIVKVLPDGYVVQFIDRSDPDNEKFLYPRTKANYVFLSNNIDVETAIERINALLKSISSNVKKTLFAMEDMIDNWEAPKAGKTFWVYDRDSSLETNGYFSGELYLRKYTSNTAYTKELLQLGDVLMAIDDDVSGMRDNRMWYVNELLSSKARVLKTSDYKDIIQLRNTINTLISNLSNVYIQDVEVDGKSVVTESTPKKAILRKSVRSVYMVREQRLEELYPGSEKYGKTFLLRGQGLAVQPLRLYDNEGNVKIIQIDFGDIFFNLDEHEEYSPYSLYVISKGGAFGNQHQPFLIVTDDFMFALLFDQLQIYAQLDTIDIEGITRYKCLKHGQELMLVLKSMGTDLDNLYAYDYNDDGLVDYQDINILLDFFLHGQTTINDVTYTLAEFNQAFPNKITNVNGNSEFDINDVTALRQQILKAADDDLFVGEDVAFAVYDPTDKKIKIGLDYQTYISALHDDVILLTLDPSPNVIYCNSQTNEIYRWNGNDMIKLISNSYQKVFSGRIAKQPDPNGIEVTFYGSIPRSLSEIAQIMVVNPDDLSWEDLVLHNWNIEIMNDGIKHIAVREPTIYGLLSEDQSLGGDSISSLSFDASGNMIMMVLNNSALVNNSEL